MSLLAAGSRDTNFELVFAVNDLSFAWLAVMTTRVPGLISSTFNAGSDVQGRRVPSHATLPGDNS